MAKKKISKITIMIIAIIILIILMLVLSLIPKERKASSDKKVNEISSPEDFNNEQEAINFTGSTFLSQKSNNIYLKFKYGLYTDEMSNQKYYLTLINYVATVREFKDFNLIDEEKNISINVTCDSNLKNIKDYKINGISNYFGKEDSKINIKKYVKTNETSFNIEANILKETINKNFEYNNINFGTIDSTLDDRKIFFEEGYDVRVIENDYITPKVFNVIFNNRYKQNVVNGINTSSTFEEIKNILGEPAFNDEELIIGYKSKDLYIFFSKKFEGIEISIYSTKFYDNVQFTDIITKFVKDKNYYNLLESLFESSKYVNDYELSNSNYSCIEYANRGIRAEFNTSNPSGITLYTNYIGNITNDITIDEVLRGEKELPDNVYFVNEDLIFLNERKRITKYYIDDNYEQSNELFCVIPVYLNGSKTLKFLSIDQNNPDFEIIDNVYDTIWLDSTHFAYSVKNKGIYMIEVTTRKITNIVNGTWIYDIKSYENGILSYDDTYIKINF